MFGHATHSVFSLPLSLAFRVAQDTDGMGHQGTLGLAARNPSGLSSRGLVVTILVDAVPGGDMRRCPILSRCNVRGKPGTAEGSLVATVERIVGTKLGVIAHLLAKVSETCRKLLEGHTHLDTADASQRDFVRIVARRRQTRVGAVGIRPHGFGSDVVSGRVGEGARVEGAVVKIGAAIKVVVGAVGTRER